MENTILKVSADEKEDGYITVYFDEAIAERIGTKKMEEYSEKILKILEEISKDL